MDLGIMGDLLEYSALAISAVGIIILIHACAMTTVRILMIELSEKKSLAEFENRKRVLIQRIILALDFFVAADLIRLMLVSTMEEIFSLALIVVIRTVLNWSLNKEIHLHKE